MKLKERRKRGDLIEAFKTIKGFNNVKKNAWFEFLDGEEKKKMRSNVRIEDGREIERQDIIYKEKANLDVRKNFYTLRVVKIGMRCRKKLKTKSLSIPSKTVWTDGWERGGRRR